MSVIGGASQGGAVDTGDIDHSLRFRASNSASLTRTITTDATSTYFAAVKRGRLGVISPIFDTNIRFNANDTLTAFGLTTTAVFRDPTSWLFIHVSNGGLYVNGVSLGAVTTSALTNPRIGFDGTNYFDGYIARIGCVSGSSSAYTNFGYMSAETNAWVTKSQSAVKAVVDAGGANSFMLDFDDGTSLTTLGYDKSSKGNNWTLNNFSLTAGATYDWMLDTPSNNFATWNPLDWAGIPGTLSNGNLRFATNTSADNINRSTLPVPGSGKWYMEFVLSNLDIGITGYGQISIGSRYLWWVYISPFWQIVGDSGASTIPSLASGDVIRLAVDATSGRAWFGLNSAWLLSGDPATNTPMTNPITVTPGTDTQLSIGGRIGSTNQIVDVNFGQRPFAHTPPTGFKALCTANLPEVTGAALNPKKHFDAITYASTGAAQDISGLKFQPDLVWVKSRTSTSNHSLIDSVRGAANTLVSNSTAAEASYPTYLTSFNPGGYSIGSGNFFGSSTAVAGWDWKAGGAPVTNTAGSITSQVSANVEAGFSIVTYTGNLTTTGASTIGHGLGRPADLIIGRSRNVSGVDNGNWFVQGKPLGVNGFLRLNTTDVIGNTSGTGGGTLPLSTSSVFSVTWNSGAGISGNNYVAYCFAEIPGYSKISSYTGNGSADGPFVYCGFRPRWVLIKRIDAGGFSWTIHDSERDPNNPNDLVLYAEASSAEGAANHVDFTAAGFKLRNLGGGWNANGGTYIFYAIAETNFKFSNAR